MSRVERERNRVRLQIGALADMLAGPTPRHDHRNGAEHCPTCRRHDHDADGSHHPSRCRRCRQLSTGEVRAGH